MPLFSYSQVTVTGTVLNITDTKPIASASVFLSNTTIGNETTVQGSFRLLGVKPGQYTLVVSILGYDTYQQKIVVADHNIYLAPISLVSTSIQLKAVRIKPNERWFRLYKDFKTEFLGSSRYSTECKILNPDILDLDYNSERQLTATSQGFLIIENKALGYRVKYLLQRFVKDYAKSTMVYTGQTIFLEIPGNAAEKEKWKKNRLDCYNGSTMHFLRSVIAGKVEAERFQVYELRTNDVAVGFWKNRKQSKYIFPDSVYERNDYFTTTNIAGTFAIAKPYLYVIYKNRLDYGLAPIYKAVNMPNWQTSIITVLENYTLFDTNGVLIDPTTVSYEGYWALMRVGDQLPVDYEPK